MYARDLDDDDADVVEHAAQRGETVEEVADGFHISVDQVWKFLCQPHRERLLEKFRENKEKKEGRWVPPKDQHGWMAPPEKGGPGER